MRTTYPFDVDTALQLTDGLLGPVKDELPGVRHLVFEPDGAMLQLPLNLLDAIRTRRETLAGFYQTLFDYQVSLLDIELATATPLQK